MLDGKYLSKDSKLSPHYPLKLITTINMNDARYWDSETHVKGVNTVLHKKFYKTYIARARIEVDLTFGEIVE